MRSRKEFISIILFTILVLNFLLPIVSFASMGEANKNEKSVEGYVDNGEKTKEMDGVNLEGEIDSHEEKFGMEVDGLIDEKLETTDLEELKDVKSVEVERENKESKFDNKDYKKNKSSIYVNYDNKDSGDGSEEKPFNNIEGLVSYIKGAEDSQIENIYIGGEPSKDHETERIIIDMNKISDQGLNIKNIDGYKFGIIPGGLLISEDETSSLDNKEESLKDIRIENIKIMGEYSNGEQKYENLEISSEQIGRGKIKMKNSIMKSFSLYGYGTYDLILDKVQLISSVDSAGIEYGDLEIQSDNLGKGELSIKKSTLYSVSIKGSVIYDVLLDEVKLIDELIYKDKKENVRYGQIEIDIDQEGEAELSIKNSKLDNMNIFGKTGYNFYLESTDFKSTEEESEEEYGYIFVNIDYYNEAYRPQFTIVDCNLGGISIDGKLAYDFKIEGHKNVSNIYGGLILGQKSLKSDEVGEISISNSNVNEIENYGAIPYNIDVEDAEKISIVNIKLGNQPIVVELKNVGILDISELEIESIYKDTSSKAALSMILDNVDQIFIENINVLDGEFHIKNSELLVLNNCDSCDSLKISNIDLNIKNSKIDIKDAKTLIINNKSDRPNNNINIENSIINSHLGKIKIEGYNLDFDRNIFNYPKEKILEEKKLLIKDSDLLISNSKYEDLTLEKLDLKLDGSSINFVNNSFINIKMDTINIKYPEKVSKKPIGLYNNLLDLEFEKADAGTNLSIIEIKNNIFTNEIGNLEDNDKIVFEELNLDEKFRPLKDSKLIDVGNNQYIRDFKIGDKDLESNLRIQGDSVDIGAYEFVEKIEKPEVKPERPVEPEVKPERPVEPEVKPERPVEPEVELERPEKTPERPMEVYPNLTEEDQDKIEKELNLEDHMAYLQGYPDSSIRPEANVTREELAAIYFRLLDPNFRDVVRSEDLDYNDFTEERWSTKYVASLSKAGILRGYKDGSFRPSKNLTRAELATVIARFRLSEYDGESIFNDIQGHWAEESINAIADIGWMDGYEDGSFRPDSFINRAEVVRATNRLLLRLVDSDGILEDLDVIHNDLDPDKWYFEDIMEASFGHEYSRREDGFEEWIRLIDNK